MLKLRICLALGLSLTAGTLQVGAAELGIPLGAHRVHPTRILARYKDVPSATAPQGAALLASQGLQVAREYSLVPGLIALDEADGGLSRMAMVPGVSSDAQLATLVSRIAALRASGLFRYVEPNYIVQPRLEPTDEYYLDGTLWGLRNNGGNGGVTGADISAREAWDITTGSTNVIVAVIDTGIRYTHQDLAAQMWVNVGETGVDDDGNDKSSNGIDDDGNGVIDDVHGINAFDPNTITGDPMDGDEHGTHVSGTIGAAANDGNPHVGVAWKVRLMGCKFLGAQGGETEGAIAAIEYATANGAQIMNNSWGGGPFSSALYDAIDQARAAGILFVVASGNSANDNDAVPDYPSTYELDNVISVAAVTRGDLMAGFSNYGAETVDLGAPGVDIWSSTSISDQSYAPFQGTSMAAPHVTGVAALIKALNPAASIFEMRQRMLQTVVPIPALQGFTVTGGRLNAYKALRATGDGELEMFVNPPEEGVILSGTNQVVHVVVTDLFGVTDANVTAEFLEGMTGGLSFRNDGQPPDDVADDEVYSSEFDVPVGINEILVRFEASAPDKLSVTNFVRWYVAEPPTNDDFVNASKIPAEGTILYSNNKFATMEFPNEPLHASVPTVDASLWWSWSPSFDNRVIIDTAGSEFDTVVAVYTNKPLADVREVVSANDSDGRRQAYVQFDAKRGVTYFLAVAGATVEDTGSIRIRLEPNGAPDALPPLVQFIAPAQGSVVTTNRITVEGLARDPYPASGVSRVMVMVEGDVAAKRANGTTNWNASVLLQPGYNTVTAVGFDYARNQANEVRLEVEYMPPTTANDHFNNAQPLEGESGTVVVDNELATKEYREPLHGDNEGGRSVWYRWEAPSDGVLTLATTNATFDSLLGVYTGTVVTNLTTIAGNDDATPGTSLSAVSFGVMGGTLYRIAVDGFSGSGGQGELGYSFIGGAVRRLETFVDGEGRVTPGPGEYAEGSTVIVTAWPTPGFVFDHWQGSFESVANPLELVMDDDYTLTAVFRSPVVSDDFETGGFSPLLNYITAPPNSSRPWFVQDTVAAEGSHAARSGVIGANEQSVLLLEEQMVAGVGSFYYRVSTEAEFDVLEFRINGVTKATWSGFSDWIFYQFVVPDGLNKLEWVFRKDSSLSIGEDAVYIDNLTVPVFRPLAEDSAMLQMARTEPGIAGMLRGEPGRRYVIEASTDLTTWAEISRVAAKGDGSVSFSDPNSGSAQTRYYRARSY